jgi:hypothetical protein
LPKKRGVDKSAIPRDASPLVLGAVWFCKSL